MSVRIKNKHIAREIKAALDGRTQRWLAHKIDMAEDKLSNKLNDIDQFEQADLDQINKVLGTSLALSSQTNNTETK